ncbi:MAG TPA: ABC transporter permease [Pirellulales bacterium]|nr:ABC transporter permease [Pirellulales bacterium]
MSEIFDSVEAVSQGPTTLTERGPDHRLARDASQSFVAASQMATEPAADAGYELILEPGRAERNYWRDLVRYRELFYILAWRDIAVRYKQTVLGVAWALVRPFLTMLIFTVIFGRLAKLPSEGEAPYPLLVLAGMLPWTLFSTALGEASNSLVANANLIGKVYFPRLIVPAAAVVVAFVDFLISLVLLLAAMVYYRFAPGWQVTALPGFLLLALLASLGPGLYLTALNVKYRDFRYIIPFVVQFGLYVSPVGFSSSVIPEKWRLLYSLNPIVGVIDGFRWCLLGGESGLYLPGFALSVTVVALFLWLGVRKFRSMERSFADII